MHTTFATRTVCCKLSVTEAADRALSDTARAFNAAATFCAQVAWDHRMTNKTALHQRVYYATRAQFGLGAQLACCARDKAAEAVRAARALNAETCPTFRPDASVRYDARTYTLLSRDRVSLNTLHGRIKAHLVLGAFQRRALDDRAWSLGGAELINRKGAWYLCITQSKANPEPDQPRGFLGVDLGIANIATASDGTAFRGHQLRALRQRRFEHRQRLQAANTRRARWRLRQLAQREHRFQKDINHCISKALVQQASREPGALWATLRLEDLTHIRKRTEATVRRLQRREHAAWAFRQLRTFIAYKAALAGVVVEYVNPRNTSRTCSACGYCEKRNRKSRDHFCCLQCGFAAPADLNAAINISRATRQLAYGAAPSSDGGASTSPQASAVGD